MPTLNSGRPPPLDSPFLRSGFFVIMCILYHYYFLIVNRLFNLFSIIFYCLYSLSYANIEKSIKTKYKRIQKMQEFNEALRLVLAASNTEIKEGFKGLILWRDNVIKAQGLDLIHGDINKIKISQLQFLNHLGYSA